MASLFRISVGRTIRQTARVASVAHPPTYRSFSSCLSIRRTPVAQLLRQPAIRYYSASAGLGKDEVEGRIKDLMKNFDKV